MRMFLYPEKGVGVGECCQCGWKAQNEQVAMENDTLEISIEEERTRKSNGTYSKLNINK